MQLVFFQRGGEKTARNVSKHTCYTSTEFYIGLSQKELIDQALKIFGLYLSTSMCCILKNNFCRRICMHYCSKWKLPLRN